MLSKQKVANSGYFFYSSGISLFTDFGAGPLSKRSKAEQEQTYSTYREGYEKMMAFLEEAESKVSEIKCYSYNDLAYWRCANLT